MSQFSSEDEAELQSLLRELLKSVKDRISGAPSVECAEEILLHLEETDKNFHNYEFVKYLRAYVESSLGTVIEEETENFTRGDGHAIGPGQDTLVHAVTKRTRESAQYKQMMQTLKQTMMVVVESLINKFEEDQLKKEEMDRKSQHEQSSSHYTDNCSDSDSSFNQSYAFIKHEQLQVIAEKLDPGRPREVRLEALQSLCYAPPSDVLSCESWTGLRRNLSAALTDPDPELSDKVLQFFAKTFASSPLNVTKDIYSTIAKSLEAHFLYHKLSFPSGSTSIDANRPDMARLLKQMRLINDFQKEVTTFWIRHPEKYMEEIIENTLSLLALHSEQGMSSPGSEKSLEPIHLISLLDIKATWFKKWMHGYYSRTVVLRLLERKYKTLIVNALQQCIYYFDSCDSVREETLEIIHSLEHQQIGPAQRTLYTSKELEFVYFIHSLCVLGRLVMYINGRKLFPIKVKKRRDPVTLTDLVVILINIMYQHPKPSCGEMTHADSLSPTNLVMEVLRTLCDRTECAVECLYQVPVIETLLAPVISLLKGKLPKLNSLESALTHIADTLARIASTERGLSLLLYDRNLVSAEGESISAAHVVVQFTQRLLSKELHVFSELEIPPAVSGAFIFVCRQMYNTCEGLQVLRPYSLHECIAKAWRTTSSVSERVPTPVPGAPPVITSQELQSVVAWEEMLLDNLLNFAATPKGLLLLQQTGAINECVTYMFSRFTKKLQSFLSLVNLLSSPHAVWELLGHQALPDKTEYNLREMATSVLDLMDRLIIINSDAKIHSLFNYEQSHTFGLRLLSVLCCNLDSFLLLESQYNLSELLLQGQRDSVTEPPSGEGEFIIDGLSVERNHILVRIGTVGGPSERRLPPRALQRGNDPYPWPMVSTYPLPKYYILDMPKTLRTKQESEISAFLASSKETERDASWMEDCRRQFCKIMATKSNTLTGYVLADFLERVVLHLSSSSTDCFFPPAEYKVVDHSVKTRSLSSVEQLGVEISLRYGKFLKLLREDSEQDLCLLLKHCQEFLSQQRVSVTSELSCFQGGYPGHDWFAASVFLLMHGDVGRSLSLLLRFSRLLPSAFLWPPRLHSSVHLPIEIAQSGIHPIYSCTAHYVEMLLKAEVPLVFSAFRMSGFTPSQEEPIHGFRVSNYLEYMEGLERNYRSMVLSDMRSILPRSS
ncbi:protein broad-minded isoform X2 [Carassius carassius]|uniref:protein broad-minded isoform X2 n=1 Tax=Carassius carassius TaxID=217509 RepID=UPI002868773D|nr:protein broad-minded isoform X2 [Carassius carassius]